MSNEPNERDKRREAKDRILQRIRLLEAKAAGVIKEKEIKKEPSLLRDSPPPSPAEKDPAISKDLLNHLQRGPHPVDKPSK